MIPAGETRHRVDEAELTRLLLELVGTASLSGQEQDVARLLANQLTQAGLSVRVDDWGNVIGEFRFGGHGPTILVDGHLDTVAVSEPASWARDPAGELHDGVIYGRGTVDTKGSLVAAIHAAALLVSADTTHSRLAGRLVVVGSLGEEVAEGPALAHVMASVHPDMVIIGEPSDNHLIIGQRGRMEIDLVVLGKPSHSAYPEEGVNAADLMAEVIVRLREHPTASHPLLGPGLLTLTNLNSFPTHSQSTVPSRAEAVYDRRTVPGESVADVLDAIAAVARDVVEPAGGRVAVGLASSHWITWTGAPVDWELNAPAWVADATTWPVLQAASGLAASGLESTPRTWGFCTNGSASAGRLGVPTIGFGPGDPSRAHQVDEGIAVADVSAGARGYAAILEALLTAAHPGGAGPGR